MKTNEKIKILKAYESGKTIEENYKDSRSWTSTITKKEFPDYDFDFEHCQYKIQENPAYRPYINVTEFLEDFIDRNYKQYGKRNDLTPLERPIIFVKGPKGEDCCSQVERAINFIDSYGTSTMIHIASLDTSFQDKFKDGWVSLEKLFKYFRYLDGSYIGKLK